MERKSVVGKGRERRGEQREVEGNHGENSGLSLSVPLLLNLRFFFLFFFFSSPLFLLRRIDTRLMVAVGIELVS
jgi:hypothetical protein